MSKILTSIFFSLLFILPFQVLAEDDGGDSGVGCTPEELCITPEPYVPSECEERMWDVYAAADVAVQDILQTEICEELVASWNIGVDDSGSGEAYNTVSDIADNKQGKAKKVVVSKRKLKKLKRQAKSCN